MKKLTDREIEKAMNMLTGAEIDYKKFHKAHKKVGIKQMMSCKKCKWIGVT